MSKKVRLPHITDELIEYLESLYPDKAPELDWSDRLVWSKRGEVGVVRHLRHLHKVQNENILDGEMNNVLRR